MYFFFNDTATTEIYTLSLHDALPISSCSALVRTVWLSIERSAADATFPAARRRLQRYNGYAGRDRGARSEEHTSELQSRQYLVCRLLLEKKKDVPHELLNH